MSLFKPYKGHRSGLDAVTKKNGNAYFCVDDGSFWIDYIDDSGTLQRKQTSAADAETLCGMTAEEIIASVNIPDVASLISAHNTSTAAHSDIRTLVTNARAAADQAQTAAGNAQTTADGAVTNAGTAQARADAAYALAEKKADATDLASHTANTTNPHNVTATQIGAVPTSRTVNGKTLSANISLTASDVGADVSGAAADALEDANAYTDEKVADLLNNSTEAVDSIMELAAAMEDNADAIEALETIAASKAAASDLTSHTGNKSNPHGVTAAQVGADPSGSASAVQTNLDTHTSNKSNPHGVTLSQLGGASSSDLTNHTGNTSNPHGVTASQVGLGNVPNVATNDQTPTYSAATSLTALTSGEKISVAFGKLAKAVSDLISHISNKSNPHGVTASQVGADASGTASTAVTSHNTNTSAHSDIRTAVSNAASAASTAQTRADAAYSLAEGKSDTPSVVSVTLSSSSWSSNAQTVTVTGVLADETAQMIQPVPAVASQSAYMTAGIIATKQAANSLTFTCTTIPTSNLTVYVVITALK